MPVLSTETYLRFRQGFADAGHGDDLVWANAIPACPDADDFLSKFVWVLCHSGMKYETGVKIHKRIMEAIGQGRPVKEVFGHKGKTGAIRWAQERKDELFKQWQGLHTAAERVLWCGCLPWIGEITRYHLARDLGEMSVCKPDRHIERLAQASGETPQGMCERLARESGDTVACVDAVLWWSAVLKMGEGEDERKRQ